MTAMPKSSAKPRTTDSGWAWVVLGAAFLNYFITLGLIFNMGILFVSFLNAFHESRSYTSWIGALQNSVFQLSGPIGSFLLPHLGARWILMLGSLLLATAYALLYIANSILYITLVYGVMAGLGGFFIIHGSIAAIAQYFEKRLYLASGIMSAGAGFGFLAVGVFIDWLLENYGWRGTVLLLSGLALQICICASLVYRNVRDEPKAQHSGVVNIESAQTNVHVQSEIQPKHRPRYLCDIQFWGSSLAIMLTNVGSITTYFFLKDIMIFSGFESTFKAHIICVGTGNTIGRITAGLVSNVLNPCLYYTIVALACSVDIFLLAFGTDEWMFFILNGMFGFCHGQLHVLQTLILAHVFGRDKMVVTYGYAMGFGSISALIGPPIGGLIADYTKNYEGTLAFLSSTVLASSLCALSVFIIQWIRDSKSAKQENTDSELQTSKPTENLEKF